MNLQTASTLIAAENPPKATVLSFLRSDFISGGIDSGDCEHISDDYFRILMALVVVATLAFGGIVHGWFL